MQERYQTLKKKLEERKFSFSYFETAVLAADYLSREIVGETVGMGGSMTLQDMGIYELLEKNNEVHWHHKGGEIPKVNAARVYLSSLNGVSETGELLNIDGVGNRVGATAYGAQRVYFVIGRNKLAPSFEAALWRARNIAGPQNAARRGADTPCVTGEMRCYDCNSPQRICSELLVFWQKPIGMEKMEIVLIDEDLGF